MEGGNESVESFLRNYRVGKTIGTGVYAKVKVAQHIRTRHKVAIKLYNLGRIKSLGVEEEVRREIKIYRALEHHPHVVRVYEVIETSLDIYVVMEYMQGGELFDYIVSKGRIDEDEARRFFQQIISGVEHCHENKIAHRDIKPENLLLDSKNNVKLADFGLSGIMQDGEFLKDHCGTCLYAAPEVVAGKHYAGAGVDVWSCGVVLYTLLCGTLPFDDDDKLQLIQKIKNGMYDLPHHLSLGAGCLITKMLVVDPMSRITVGEIRQHSWYKVDLPPDGTQHLRNLDEEIVKKVITMGFDRNQLIDSLKNGLQNDATVAYYLLFDNRGDQEAGFQESMEQEAYGFPLDISMSPQISTHNRWAIIFQAQAQRYNVFTHILDALQELKDWCEATGTYCILGDRVLQSTITIIADRINPTNANLSQCQTTLQFQMQLYKTEDMKYLLDLQRLTGPVFLFLDICASLMMRLDIA